MNARGSQTAVRCTKSQKIKISSTSNNKSDWQPEEVSTWILPSLQKKNKLDCFPRQRNSRNLALWLQCVIWLPGLQDGTILFPAAQVTPSLSFSNSEKVITQITQSTIRFRWSFGAAATLFNATETSSTEFLTSSHLSLWDADELLRQPSPLILWIATAKPSLLRPLPDFSWSNKDTRLSVKSSSVQVDTQDPISPAALA